MPDRSASAVRSDPAALPLVESFVDGLLPATGVEVRLQSDLLSALVWRGWWSVARAFEKLPRGADDALANATEFLAGTLAGKITPDDARAIVAGVAMEEVHELSRSRQRWYEKRGRPAPPRWRLNVAAMKELARQPEDLDALRTLIPHALSLPNSDNEVVPSLHRLFMPSPAGRRELFLAGVAAQKQAGEANQLRWFHRLLVQDDLGWLAERLVALAEDAPLVWWTALRLGSSSHDPELRARVEALVAAHAPGVAAEFCKAREQEQELEQELGRPGLQPRQRQVVARPIADLDRELLADPRMDLQEQLWELSAINFSDRSRRSDLAGRWEDRRAEREPRFGGYSG